MFTFEETKELYKKSFKVLEKDWYIQEFDCVVQDTFISVYKKYPNIILFLDFFMPINNIYQLDLNIMFYLDKDHYSKIRIDDYLITDIIKDKNLNGFYQIIEQMIASYCRSINIPKPSKSNLLIYNEGDYFLFHPKDNPLKKHSKVDSTIESIISIMSYT